LKHHITILPSGHAFDVVDEESVLDAARRAGYALPYSCLSGSCGSCRARLLEGECVESPEARALTAEERARGDVLLCQAHPRSDLTIAVREVPSVADLPRRMLTLRLVERDLLAEDVLRLRLRAPQKEPFRWLAGQYLDVLLPEGKRRAFSIANAPEDAGLVELHVRRVPGGGFTQQLFDAYPLGTLMRVEGPLGTFVPREDSERPMIFMAGGTGFAPVKAIIEHFLHLGSARPMHLFWGARHVPDLYLPDLPQQWVARHPAFAYTPVLSEADAAEAARLRHGFVHEAVLAEHPDLSGFDVYMSGPPPMIEAARHRFAEAGVPMDRLYYDSFEYAPEVIAAILAARAGLRS
jgi:CDP-4-dehydro-6-deoxyglucose reductase, E3